MSKIIAKIVATQTPIEVINYVKLMVVLLNRGEDVEIKTGELLMAAEDDYSKLGQKEKIFVVGLLAR